MKFLPPRDFTLGDDNEEWMNLNIQKDPPKGIFTQYRNKRHERSVYNFEKDRSRYEENLEKYARGVDPMKDIQMNNTKGTQQAYKPIINRILRVPVRTEFELLPLSRLPYIKKGFTSKKNAPLSDKQILPESSRTIIENQIKPSMFSKLSAKVLGGVNRKKEFAKQKHILSTPYITNKNDKIRLDFEKLRLVHSQNEKIRENTNSHSVSSKKNISSNLGTLSLNESMIHENKISVQQSSTKSHENPQRINLAENPSRGVGEENTIISVSSSKNNKINTIQVHSNVSKEIEENPVVSQIASVKTSNAKLESNRTIDSLPMQDVSYKNVHAKKSLIKGKTSIMNRTDEFLVQNPIQQKTNVVKKPLYTQTNLNSYQNQILPEKNIIPESIQARKNTFQKITNNQIDIKTNDLLPKDPFTRLVGFVPTKIRDVNVAPNILRVKN